MSNEDKIGVYICHCGTNIAGNVEVSKVSDYIAELDDVEVAKDYEFMCSDPGQDMIGEDIKEKGLTKVVVAACSPALHEETFMEVIESAGLNRFLFQQANIREHCSWVTGDEKEATEKSKKLIKAAVCRVRKHDPLEVSEVEVTPRTLVVGGGISGIEAALNLADSGKEVYLVEKSPSIGGHMAQLDKTFPTLDCSSCILTPKMGNAVEHPNIKLLTYSEVEDMEGHPGNYEVKIRRKARYVDENECTGCGICQEKCPQSTESEFDEGLGERKAIYTPFPQAVPQVPVIDEENCLYLQEEKCGACEENCPADAVEFEQEDEIKEIDFGNIIIATGYDLFDPSEIEDYHYGEYDNVFTALEVERMVDATGPTGGEVLTSNGEEPESIAIIHCVGSRDESYHKYCSRVCCMYSMKLAHIIKEETDADIYEFYIDLRAPGKRFEEFYDGVLDEGVRFVRGKPGSIEKSDGKLIVNCEDSLADRQLTIPADMVVLSPAMEPRSDSDEMANTFRLNRSEDGFLMERHPKLAPVNTSSVGIFLAGVCQGPKDIPDSVAQGGAAAEKADAMINAGTLELEPYVSEIDEEICAGCKTCISVCPFDAVEFDEEEGVSRIEETLCRGCGTCVAVCPSGAAQQFGYKDKQVTAELIANVEGVEGG